MADAKAAAARKPCCVCGEPGGKHCTKCKSRHYCSKACQLVDWNDRGHKAQCRQMAADFQNRMLDELMPEKLKIKEEPAIVADVAPADGSMAAARLSAVWLEKTAVKATAPNEDTPDWRGICAVCLDLLPIKGDQHTFYACCCKRLCTACSDKCLQHDERCPLCRALARASDAEYLRRLQKHADKGNAEAQIMLGNAYRDGTVGLKQNFKRAVQQYERAAAQRHSLAQNALGYLYQLGKGVKIDHEAAAQWYRRAAERGYPAAQCSLGVMFYYGQGVAQSYEEAVRWFRLAAQQGQPDAIFYLGICHAFGHQGAPQDDYGAMRLFKSAAAKGHAGAAAEVDKFEKWLAATSGRPA